MRFTLATVRRRLPQLVRRFGPYGWPDLQVVLTDAAGMEHTGLIMTPPDDLTISHELAHEWWYALIGDDQAADPWLDEGFATYAEWRLLGTAPPCRGTGGIGRVMSRGVDFFRSRPVQYIAVYWGGGCLLVRLERRMGGPAFRRALREYVAGLRHGWSTEARFMAAMDAAAAPRRLDDLWRAYRLTR
jgi:aminopeptidase N